MCANVHGGHVCSCSSTATLPAFVRVLVLALVSSLLIKCLHRSSLMAMVCIYTSCFIYWSRLGTTIRISFWPHMLLHQEGFGHLLLVKLINNTPSPSSRIQRSDAHLSWRIVLSLTWLQRKSSVRMRLLNLTPSAPLLWPLSATWSRRPLAPTVTPHPGSICHYIDSLSSSPLLPKH